MDLGELNIPFIYKGSDLVHPSPIKDGLVLWYDFSGMSNSFENRGIATDLSGNGNHGTLQNFAYSEGSGYDKRGLLFDGVDDEISTKSNQHLENLRDISLEATINVEEIGETQRIIDKNWEYFSLAIWANGTINFNTGGLEFKNNHSNTRLLKNKKYHIVASYNNLNGAMYIYINGKQDAYYANSGELTGNTQDLFIGNYRNGQQPLDGDIYSSRIYNRPLTPEEIQHNYEIEKERFGIGGSEL